MAERFRPATTANIPFSLPAEHFNSPVRVPTVPQEADPFRGCSLPFGADHERPEIRQVAENALDGNLRAFAMTLLTPGCSTLGEISRRQFDEAQRVVQTEVARRVGSDGHFFVMDADGHMFQVGVVPYGLKFLQTFGMWDDEINRALNMLSTFAPQITEKEARVSLALLRPSPGMTVIELGAGHSPQRLQVLHDELTAHRATLLCHDVAPEFARQAAHAGLTAPYITVPPYAQFLTPSLQPVAGRVSFSLHDVLSSMALTEVYEWMQSMGDLGAERVVISQSRGMSERSCIYVTNLSPSSTAFALLLEEWFAHPDSSSLVSPQTRRLLETPEGIMLAHAQASLTYGQLSLELMLTAAQLTAEGLAHLPHQSLVRTTAATDLTHQEANIYLTASLPWAVPYLEAGMVNYMRTGPDGAVELDHIHDVPAGQFRLHHDEWHLVLDRTAPLDAVSGPAGITLSVEAAAVPFIPRPKRLLSPLSAYCLTVQADGHPLPPTPAAVQSWYDGMLPLLYDARRATMSTIFGHIGPHFGMPLVTLIAPYVQNRLSDAYWPDS